MLWRNTNYKWPFLLTDQTFSMNKLKKKFSSKGKMLLACLWLHLKTIRPALSGIWLRSDSNGSCWGLSLFITARAQTIMHFTSRCLNSRWIPPHPGTSLKRGHTFQRASPKSFTLVNYWQKPRFYITLVKDSAIFSNHVSHPTVLKRRDAAES